MDSSPQQTWFVETERSWLERLAINVLKAGQMPKHVAFIMDGNRRYASKNHLESPVVGHVHGFNKLTKVCYP